KHGDRITSIAVFPDGKRAVSSAFDGSIVVWDLEKAAPVFSGTVGEPRQAAMRVVASGGRFAAAGLDMTRDWTSEELRFLRWTPAIRVWDATTGAVLRDLPLRKTPNALAFHPDGRRIVATGDAVLVVLDTEDGSAREI